MEREREPRQETKQEPKLEQEPKRDMEPKLTMEDELTMGAFIGLLFALGIIAGMLYEGAWIAYECDHYKQMSVGRNEYQCVKIEK